ERGSALQQYEHLVTILDRELGVGPLPETEAVYQAILQTRPLPEAVLATREGWTTLPSLDVGLVGRHTALNQLEETFDRARAGRGGAVLISGEPGIGKSRLMQDFASRLQDEVLLLVGAAYRDTQTTPYEPIVEALRPALRAGYAWFDAPPCCLAETSLLVPELRTLYSTRPPSASEGTQARTRLFEALTNLTLALAAGPHPVLLCLDDLQWADDTTLDWLAYLGRRALDRRILLVGTYRTEDAGTVAQLRRNLSRLGNLPEIELRGLDEAAILQAIQNLHGGRSVRGDSLAAARLQEATGGNPFFILEILRALLDSEQPMQVLANFNDLPLPESVVEVVETRVGRLSPRARQVLEAGSVLGQAFTFDLVRRTSGRGEMETIDGLDELVARHLLAEQNGEHQFPHELIRMAVYHGLGHHRRQVLHRRAGKALKHFRRGDFAALAWHLARAGKLGQAAEYALQAGREAKAIFAHVEARAHFDGALELLREEAARLDDADALAGNRRLRIEAFHERGWVLRLLGDMEAYARDLEEVARLVHLLQDQRALAHLRWREAYTHRWFCRYAQARQAAEEGLALSRQDGDRLLEARCFREIGMAHRETGNYDAAREALEG
ncbi:MAG: AAA family ATPase, partial [Anaerolineae bacterium]|nr:AAA family ATPase [Anaerolineae bacterium]